jgi:hypothetical protein
VVFVVAESDPMCWLAVNGASIRAKVLPGKGHSGAVVVQLAHVHIERANGVNHNIGKEGRAVSTKEEVQAPADPIVVEELIAAARQAEQGLLEMTCPRAQTIEWLSGDKNIAQEYAKPDGGAHLEALVVARDVFFKKAGQS